jgi:DNA-binding NarL/FixJ family response regulator
VEPRRSDQEIAGKTGPHGTKKQTQDADSARKRVFIVDDHAAGARVAGHFDQPAIRPQGLRRGGSAADALKLIGTAKPHVAIVDISMEGGSGIELIKTIKAICPVMPEVAVIVLSMHDEALYGERALRAGARGYVMKREATKNVLQAIRCVLKGEMYLSDKMAKMMAEKFVEGKSRRHEFAGGTAQRPGVGGVPVVGTGLGHPANRGGNARRFQDRSVFQRPDQGKAQTRQRHRTAARSRALARQPETED